MMLVLARSLIILTFLILGIRLMGKRTIGELQPYEFVITLAVADLACTPMQDISIPLLYGLVPLFTVFVAHYFITLVTTKSIKLRERLNGKPFIVIDNDGINSECLKKLNLNVNDLMSLIRQQGYFSVTQISYGIIETNGKLSILENEEAETPRSIPMTLMVEGKILDENIKSLDLDETKIRDVLEKQHIKEKDVVLMTADSGNVFIQPKSGKYVTVEGL
ncbi:MAG: DUF421 domain-containing protein [Eubacteriales bacterium]|nr:DUF421 domain-containing protein [Eubacteriales bacterium]